MSAPRLARPLRVFISFSHRDDLLRERFLVHLSQLRRQGLIDAWHDRRITPGGDWAGQIDEHLRSAHITILLVSADFLASDYCNDVEMDCALKRSRHGETIMVPVILGPCDWKDSALAGFQALPRDGKPVVDWPTTDHGFENAVNGLRHLIAELCGSAPVRMPVLPLVARWHPWRLSACGLLVVVLFILSWMWLSSLHYLRQGTDLLNVGRYADAKRPLEQAKRMNPFSAAARCGLDAVELDMIRADPVRFERRLSDASQQYPRCTYLELLIGEQKQGMKDMQGAQEAYQLAIRGEPKFAEAYFNMGRLLDLEGDPDSALGEYQKAVQLSPGTARYANNLADLYFRREEYDKAIEEYGRISNFPLASLEAAKIYRLQDKLQDAEGREQDAIQWLRNPDIRRAEADTAWDFDVSPTRQVQLRLIEEKECYAEMELAVTQFLQLGEKEALTAISAALDHCSSRQQELKDVLVWELRRLGNQTPPLTPRSEQITSSILGSGM